MARAKKPKDIAVKAVGSEQSAVETRTPAGESGEVVQTEARVDTIVDGVVELSNGVDAGPARSMADDLEEIVGRHKASPRAIFEGYLRALEAEAENHPQGMQGCMIFDPARAVPYETVDLLEHGVWRAYPESLWQFWIVALVDSKVEHQSFLVVKAVRTDMVHLREAPENVRELAA